MLKYRVIYLPGFQGPSYSWFIWDQHFGNEIFVREILFSNIHTYNRVVPSIPIKFYLLLNDILLFSIRLSRLFPLLRGSTHPFTLHNNA